MDYFLRHLADHINTNFAGLSHDLVVVVPNKRAPLFIQKHLSNLIESPVWLPEIYSVESFIEKLSGLEVLDGPKLIFELYATYSNSMQDEAEPMEDFLHWADILIRDFNEVDSQMVEGERFFNFLTEIKAMEMWNPGRSELTEMQQNYLAFWDHFGTWHKDFSDNLRERGLAYHGLALRHAAENVESHYGEYFHDARLLFAGFNALSKAEEVIIDHLLGAGKASLLWDADPYYLDNDQQEAGTFLRKYRKKWSGLGFEEIGQHWQSGEKRIEIAQLAQNTGQAAYVASLLEHLGKDENYQDTAIVLGDEHLLLPVLQMLPPSVQTINVTMGFPLRYSPYYGMFDAIIRLLISGDRSGTHGQRSFHYKDLSALLLHPQFTLHLNKEERLAIKQFRTDAINNNTAFFSQESLDTQLGHIPAMAQLIGIENIQGLLDYFHYLVHRLREYWQSAEFRVMKMEQEALFHFHALFNQLEHLQQQYTHIGHFNSFRLLFQNLVNSSTIDLVGEPLEGLQIMGMLETRTLDFKNIILLSANEGILPKGKSSTSFIPYELIREFKLPSFAEKDAVYAYHFYRLLQRAENIHLLYTTQTDEFGSGEKSRFLVQLDEELPRVNPEAEIVKNIINVSPSSITDMERKVAKSPYIISKLQRLLEEGVSPTALYTYINCPLDFYYKYVIGLREDEEVEEHVDASTLGTVIHEVLEQLFGPFQNQELTPEHLNEMVKQLPEVLEAVFSNHFPSGQHREGKNVLSYNIAGKYIRDFLKSERQRVTERPIRLFQVESQQSGVVPGGKLRLKGVIDRVEETETAVRVIDYKSGNAESRELQVDHVSDLFEEGQYQKAFQLLTYSWLSQQGSNMPEGKALEAGIISFRRLKQGILPLRIGGSQAIERESLEEFERQLMMLSEEILDPHLLFEHRKAAKYCAYCR